MSFACRFFGVRGSVPVPGPGTVRYGGNTPSLGLEAGGRRLLIDAGTGIRGAGRWMAETGPAAPLEVDVLLSHTHWDHIQGLPFFRPLHGAGNRVTIHGPTPTEGSLEAVLQSQMAFNVFPVPLAALAADLRVAEITTPDLTVAGFEVSVIQTCHPGPTLGFSVRSPATDQSLIYITDNELGGQDGPVSRPDLVRFLRRSSTLVHDAMYFESEKRARFGWGHSTAVDAVRLALDGGCARLVLFHHDPDHDDEAVDRVLAEALAARDRLGGSLEITAAREGTTLHL